MWKYNPKYKPNQLICGSGQIAIVTGWTIKESVAKKLNTEEYAVVGQLYSPTRGISFLIRNLLLNPHVHYVVALAATKEDENSKGIQCLSDFFLHGFKEGLTDTGRLAWIINSDVTGYIDIEIPKEKIEKLRQCVFYRFSSTVESCIAQVRSINEAKLSLLAWGDSCEFAIAATESKTIPGSPFGCRIEGKTIAETWVKIIHRIKTTGVIRPTGYDGKWQELLNLTAVVTHEPEECYFPNPNYLPLDREFLNQYIPQILDDAPYREGIKYTYGQRLRSWFGKDQIEQVINKIISEVDAASAVMSLWDVKDHEKGGSPCLNHIWVRVIDDVLHLTALFRSNDMFSAWPSNAMGLKKLQIHITEQINNRSTLNLKIGTLTTISQSAHIYDDCWENAEKLIENQYKAIARLKDYDDPSGNFIVEIKNGKVYVNHTTSGSGEIVGEYSGTTALNIINKICMDVPGIQPSHAAYLGMEIEKACSCLALNKNYIQDKNI